MPAGASAATSLQPLSASAADEKAPICTQPPPAAGAASAAATGAGGVIVGGALTTGFCAIASSVRLAMVTGFEGLAGVVATGRGAGGSVAAGGGCGVDVTIDGGWTGSGRGSGSSGGG